MIKYHQTNLVISEFDSHEIKRLIESGSAVNGKYVKALEDKLQSTFNVKYAIVCANCTTGLIIALKGLGMSGKTIAVPAFTWFSTPYAITCNYNIPYFIDINKETWLMEEFDESYVDAIMSVDIFGNKFSVKTKKRVPVIFDAAHGYGLKDLGHRGIVEMISFSFTKIVQGGQGGAILTNDDNVALKCREMVNRYGKMTEINSFLTLKSINDFPFNQKRRILIIDEYKEYLKVNYSLQKVPDETNYSVFAILLETTEIRDKLYNALTKNEVEVKVYYHPVVETNEYFKRMLPNTFDVYSRILALPVYPGIEDRIEYICKIMNEAI